MPVRDKSKTCIIEGCSKSVFARNWCTLHYQRWRSHGDPLWEPQKPKNPPGMKVCSGCGEEKRLSEFHKQKNGAGGLNSKCKTCRALWYKESRDYIDSLKSVPCADCGIQYPPWVMQFDHCFGEKIIAVAKLLGYPRAKIDEEVAKCEVVCANDHFNRTYMRRIGTWKQ